MRAIAWLVVMVTACGTDTPPAPVDPETDPDPLDITTTPAAGSLDELHERVIAQRCSGQPGLCHNGQFEPNLSTPALMFAYVVDRPGIEKQDRLRVKPGDSNASLMIDKIRNRNGVATQMPLGAEPLEEADIQAIEAWINGGALRAPGADPAPVLNNPPKRPEIAIFSGATRLDGTGPINVAPGSTLTLRHTVQDFETADAAIPFAALILSLADGQQVILTPGSPEDPGLAQTTFDAAGPQGKGDQLNYRFTWNIPTVAAGLPTVNPDTGIRSSRSPVGQDVSVLVVYVDGSTPGIVAIDTSTTPIQIR
ncbi:MAG: hypothetical protein ABI867_23095 [Kofleriaceae bacterium]